MFGMRLITLALIALVAAAPATADAAPAKKTRKKAIWGPTQVNGHSAFSTYHDLGVGIWQVLIHWDEVARRRPEHPTDPHDPAYRWPKYVRDGVRAARKRGIKVNIAVMGSPGWANGGKPWMYAPKRARDYAHFMKAASRKYRYVNHWMVWIEPMRSDNWRPLIPERRNHKLNRKQRRAPQRYAKLLDTAYGAIKSVDRRDKVIGGNSFVTGDISPMNWVRYMRLKSGRRARMDLWGHNPFGYRKPRLRDPALGNGFVDFGTLDTFARRVDRYQRKGLKLFLSEYTIPTDHSNHEFNFYATKKTQAAFAKAALRIARRWKRIYTLGWFALTDEAPRPAGDENNRGLMTYQGVKKPSYFAYKRN
jgi:hypothetical protein